MIGSMRRSIAGATSVVVHAVLVAAIAMCAGGRARTEGRREPPIGLTMIATTPVTMIATIATPEHSASAGGGGGGLMRSPSMRSTHATSPRRAQAARAMTPAAITAPTAPDSDPDSDPVTDPDSDSDSDSDPDPDPDPATASSGSGSGPGGSGTGHGTGTGSGRGPGTGASWTASLAAAAPSLARRSLARPARLIWPVRSGSEAQGTLYTVRVDVDVDGYVAGVRLLDSSMSRRDQRAADAVWKFRYDPARDHAGRPIASTLEQPFILRR